MESFSAFPIAIIDEGYEGNHAAGRGMWLLAAAIEKQGFRVVAGLGYEDAKGSMRHGEEPGADIAPYLAQHDAHVEVERLSSHGSPITEIIVSHAMNRGVDLIVIGAYSRPRSVQLVFGGVTRTLLKQSPLPLLISR